MSFEDVEGISMRSPGPPSPARRSGNPEIARGIFQLNTSVAQFWWLLDAIGTARDNVEHRQKLANARLSISKLVKDVSAKLKSLNDSTDPGTSLSKRVEGAKLARDFEAVLLDFQKAQRLAAERETLYALAPSPSHRLTSSLLDEYAARPDENQERERLLRQQKKQEVTLLENELAFNEAMIEEREQEIKETQAQIGDVNEKFRDLAVLVHEQGTLIDDIDKTIDAVAATTVDAEAEVAKASKSFKSKPSCCCWLPVIAAVVVVIAVAVVLVILL